MLVIPAKGEAELVSWEPDFSSSGQDNPTLAKILYGKIQLTNALNHVDWQENPVQVVLCETCGFDGCADGGWVNITRLGDHLLWTRPKFSFPIKGVRETKQYETSGSVSNNGSVLVLGHEWDRWVKKFKVNRTYPSGLLEENNKLYKVLPEKPLVVSVFHQATRYELGEAWLGEFRSILGIVPVGEILDRLRERILIVDGMEIAQALEIIEQIINWINKSQDDALEHELVRINPVNQEAITDYQISPALEIFNTVGDVNLITFVFTGRENKMLYPFGINDNELYLCFSPDLLAYKVE